MSDDKKPTDRLTFSEAAAATVAVVAFCTLMGVLLLGLRYSRADLPVVESLAVTPRQAFPIYGAKEMIVPFLLFALALPITGALGDLISKTAADRTVRRWEEQELGPEELNRKVRRVQLVAFGLSVFFAAVLVAVIPFLITAVGLCAIATEAWTTRTGISRFTARLAGGAIGATLVLSFYAAFGPPDLPNATVRLTSGAETTGVYIGSTSTFEYIGTEQGAVAFQQRRIDRITIASPPPRENPPTLAELLLSPFT